jgi:hypothetical protein
MEMRKSEVRGKGKQKKRRRFCETVHSICKVKTVCAKGEQNI